MEIEPPIQSAVSPDVPGRSGPGALTKAATALDSPREVVVRLYRQTFRFDRSNPSYNAFTFAVRPANRHGQSQER